MYLRIFLKLLMQQQGKKYYMVSLELKSSILSGKKILSGLIVPWKIKYVEISEKAYIAEVQVLDWIFEHGELDWISKDEVQEFLKYRFNDSLNQIGYESEYEIDDNKLKKSDYLERNVIGDKGF